MVWLSDGEKLLRICLFISTDFTNVTDRRMDRHCMMAYAQHRTPKITDENNLLLFTDFFMTVKSNRQVIQYCHERKWHIKTEKYMPT